VISAAAAARCLLDMSATMPRLRRKHNDNNCRTLQLDCSVGGMDVHRLRVLRAVVADGSIQGAQRASATPRRHQPARQRAAEGDGAQACPALRAGIEPTAAGRAVAAEAARIFERLATSSPSWRNSRAMAATTGGPTREHSHRQGTGPVRRAGSPRGTRGRPVVRRSAPPRPPPRGPRGGRLDPPPGALDKPEPRLLLQHADVWADGRRGVAEARCGRLDRTVRHDPRSTRSRCTSMPPTLQSN